MLVNRTVLHALVLGSATLLWGGLGLAQEPPKPKDEALDALIKELSQPEGDKKPSAPDANPKTSGTSTAKGADSKAKADVQKPKSAPEAKPSGSGEVSSKDKELDDFLEKLGETKDEPTPEERRPRSPRTEEKSGSSQAEKGKGEKKQQKDAGLQGKDKELDERLEEFTGRKKKRKGEDDQEGGGPLGQIVKEMRDVEQRLGKPDTGGDTQAKQKQIVKQLDTIIEQMRRSSSSSEMMAMRKMMKQGQKPGDQPGQEPGATAGGAPRTSPVKPSTPKTLPGGKEIWGHLPPELRQEMENVFKEGALPTKEDLIRRYYLSISKQKLVRGE